jgi:CDP-diacylglycerol--serine O-phosphatidyltransferase
VQVSFGCAPAFAAFALGLRTPLDTVILTGFVCCGVDPARRVGQGALL